MSSTDGAQQDGLAPGTVVGGRYRVVSKLGEGGMGAVYRATQEPLGREVALKVIAAALAVDKGAVERFQREAKASSSLSHPNIVTVYDYGSDAGGLYLAMELIPGTPGDKLVERGPLPWQRAITLLRGVCAALAEAHARGIVHRDLKPANILVTSTKTQDDIAKVVDFGIAKMKDGGATLTMTGAVVGTPGYVAPELFDGKEPSPLTDLYAVGVVAFEFLCGRAPFPGKTPMELIKAHILTTPPAPSLYVSDVPAALDELVLSLLAKDPAQRPQSAEDLDARLAVIAAAPVVARAAVVVPPAPLEAPKPAPTTTPSTGMIQGLSPAQRTEMAGTPLPPPSSSRAGLSPATVVVGGVLGVVAICAVVVTVIAVSFNSNEKEREGERKIEALGRRVVDVAADGGVIGVGVDNNGDVRVTNPNGTEIYDALTFKTDAGVVSAADEIERKAKLAKIAKLFDDNGGVLGGGGGGGGGSGGGGGGALRPREPTGGSGGVGKGPLTARAELSAGTPVVLGSLDADIIRRVVLQHAAQVKYCFEKELIRNPKMSGKVVAKFVINGEGNVTTAQAAETTLHNASVESCVINKVKTWVFPKPKGGGIVVVNYPFIFRSAAE